MVTGVSIELSSASYTRVSKLVTEDREEMKSRG